jgi:hypothetical protein
MREGGVVFGARFISAGSTLEDLSTGRDTSINRPEHRLMKSPGDETPQSKSVRGGEPDLEHRVNSSGSERNVLACPRFAALTL